MFRRAKTLERLLSRVESLEVDRREDRLTIDSTGKAVDELRKRVKQLECSHTDTYLKEWFINELHENLFVFCIDEPNYSLMCNDCGAELRRMTKEEKAEFEY